MIHFLETRIQRLLDGLIFIEKGLGVHVQRTLKMGRVYTLADIEAKILGKTKDNWGPYLRSRFVKLTIWCQLIFYQNISCDHCLHDFLLYKCWLIEKWSTFKHGTFFIFLYTFTINCATTGARKRLIEYMFYFICSDQWIKIIALLKTCGLIV